MGRDVKLKFTIVSAEGRSQRETTFTDEDESLSPAAAILIVLRGFVAEEEKVGVAASMPFTLFAEIEEVT